MREYWGGMDEAGVILSPFNQSVPIEIQDKVMAEAQKLMNGQDTIFAGPLKDNTGKEMVAAGAQSSDKDLLSMQWLVEGVSGSIPK